MMRRFIHHASIAAAAMILTACSPPGTLAPQTDPGPSPSIASTPTPLSPSPEASTEPWHDDPESEVEGTFESDPERIAAAAAATSALDAFLSPLPADQWFAQLRPHLSEMAAVDYSYSDPRGVPGTRIVGDAKPIPTESDRATRVQIPTDAGDYVLTMSRISDEAPWLVERFILPETDPD